MLGSALLFDHIRDLGRICEFSIILSSGQYIVNTGKIISVQDRLLMVPDKFENKFPLLMRKTTKFTSLRPHNSIIPR
jgi:hypothetical protein